MEAGKLWQEDVLVSFSVKYNIAQKCIKEVIESLKQQVTAIQGSPEHYPSKV